MTQSRSRLGPSLQLRPRARSRCSEQLATARSSSANGRAAATAATAFRFAGPLQQLQKLSRAAVTQQCAAPAIPTAAAGPPDASVRPLSGSSGRRCNSCTSCNSCISCTSPGPPGDLFIAKPLVDRARQVQIVSESSGVPGTAGRSRAGRWAAPSRCEHGAVPKLVRETVQQLQQPQQLHRTALSRSSPTLTQNARARGRRPGRLGEGATAATAAAPEARRR